MLYIISFFMVIIEVSLPLAGNMYGVTLPFLTYLVSMKKEREVFLVIVLALLHSLQTNSFFEILIILLVSYYIFYYIFTHLTYGKTSIILITFLQGIIYYVLSINNFRREYFVVNICIFIILNYVYMRISRKKDSIKG
jgi:hypothetical protein